MTYDNFELITLNNGTYGIKSFSGCLEDVEIPSSINGIDVTYIGFGAFKDCSKIKSVLIPSTINYISQFAFHNCSNLKDIVISEGVVTIGEEAFSKTGIENFTLPHSAIKIGRKAFGDCKKLKRVTLSNEINITPSLFEGCYNLEGVSLPSNMTMVYPGLFYGCKKMSTLTIPSGVTKISSRAFESSGLKDIQIPEGAKEIGYRSFAKTPLNTITIPDSVEIIGDEAFAESEIRNIVIPKNAFSIGDGVFKGCKKLTKIVFQQEFLETGRESFNDCVQLEEIDISAVKAFGNAKAKEVGKLGRNYFTSSFKNIPNLKTIITCDKPKTDLCKAIIEYGIEHNNDSMIEEKYLSKVKKENVENYIKIAREKEEVIIANKMITYYHKSIGDDGNIEMWKL